MNSLRRLAYRLEAFALLLAAGPAYGLLPTRTFLRWWTPGSRAASRPADVDAAGLAAAVDGVLALCRRRNCLIRSLVLYRMLRRRGADVRLRIGVRRAAPGEIGGHAWLVLDGALCCPYGPDPSEYAVTLAHPDDATGA